jgi:electron transport complex protein RnfG
MDVWFKDSAKPSQSIINRNLSEGLLSVSKDGGEIDAITASTITSRAFLEAVNRAYTAYTNSNVDTTTGATDSTWDNENNSTEEVELTEEEISNE